MRRFAAIIFATMLSLPVFGQKVESRKPNADVLLELLRGHGYDLYSFDLSGVGAVEGLELREYENGKEIRRSPDNFPEHNIKSIDIGFYPVTDGETVRRAQVMVNGNIGIIRMHFDLRKLDTPETERIYYDTRPYVHSGKIASGFVPLVMLGSGWWDARSGMIRFCGVTELETDDPGGFAKELFGNMPHFYIIGINVK